MSNWLREFVNTMLLGHPSSLWPIFLAPVLVSGLLRPALKLIEQMPAGSASQRQMAFLATIIPGAVFWCMVFTGPRFMPVCVFHSASCFAHCAVLAGMCLTAALRSCIHFGRQGATLGQLMRLRQPPSPRLERVASALGLVAWELPTTEALCCVAGIFRPKLLVSRGTLNLLSDEELRAALLHERAHWRSRETLWVSIAAFLNQNTLLTTPSSLELFQRTGDYAADKEAAKEADPATLASTLLRFSRVGVRAHPLAINLAAGESVLFRARLLVAEPERSRNRGAGLKTMCAAALLILAAAMPTLSILVRFVGRVWCRI